ncbi:MAG: hypothetical protein JWP38_911 [Herbaspirillum sp.]|nr:hypothetical protein [Herbaspirillum sp.]
MNLPTVPGQIALTAHEISTILTLRKMTDSQRYFVLDFVDDIGKEIRAAEKTPRLKLVRGGRQ